MLILDFMGKDVLLIGETVVRIGERTDYGVQTYVVPLFIEDGEGEAAEPVFLRVGDEHWLSRDPGIFITARPKRGLAVQLGVEAPRSIRIDTERSDRRQRSGSKSTSRSAYAGRERQRAGSR